MAQFVSLPPSQLLSRSALCAAIFLAWPALSCAQRASSEAHDVEFAQAPLLKAVVVSGSRSERASEDVPATIELISSEQIERQQTTSIRDLVNEVPNASVRRRSNRSTINNADGREGNAGFNIRGLEGNRILLLVDGLRAPRNYSFGASSRDNFGIGLIDRVEIIKGPSSALYGSDGIGGLVQFFTKSPEHFLKGGNTLGGQASVGYSGEDKGTQLGVTVAGQLSPQLQWMLSGSVTQASELANMGSNSSPNLDRTQPNPQTDKEQSLLGKLVWRPSAAQKHIFTLESVDKRADLNLLSLVSKPPLVATSVLSASSHTDNERQRLSWQGQFKSQQPWADEIKAALSWQDFNSREYFANDRYTAGDQIRDTRDTETTLQANVQVEKIIRGHDTAHKLIYGLDLTQITADHLQTGQTPPAGETFPLKRFPKTQERNTAVFVQDELMGERWSIIPALRWDRYTTSPKQTGFVGTAAALSGSAVSPKLGGTFKLDPQWTLYSQWATGFKAPSADQVNRFFENTTSFYKTVPNPQLRAEKSKSLEIGIKGRAGDVELDAAVFRSKFNDFINNNQVVSGTGAPGNPIVYQAVNVQSVSIHGFEVKGDYKFSRTALGQWSMPFAYGQTRGQDDMKGLPLNSIDPAKLNLGVQLAAAWGDVRLEATHRAAKKTSEVDAAAAGTPTQLLTAASTTLDLSGQWKIRKGLRLNASLSNLTNKKYWRWSDVQGISSTAAFVDAYSQPGRKFNLNLTADF